jgi:FkbH-like protein
MMALASNSIPKIALFSDHSDERLAKLIADGMAGLGNDCEVVTTAAKNGLFEILNSGSEVMSPPPDVAIINLCGQAIKERFYTSSPTDRSGVFERFKEQIDSAVEILRAQSVRVFVTTVCPPVERMHGHLAPAIPGSLSSLIHLINRHFHALATSGVCVLVDVEHLAARYGLDRWQDERLWYHAKYSCHPRCLPLLANAMVRVLRVAMGQEGTKVIVLDLDNTLWGGIIGDDGIEGISLGGVGEGEAFRDFQRYLNVLKERGLILCVCSKNQEATARLPFQSHDAMVLREEDITLFVANWERKSDNIENIAKTLRIGLDSIVFIDDSPFERHEVRTALPDVRVPEMPSDPALYVWHLENEGLFESVTLPSKEDLERTASYQAEMQRLELTKQQRNPGQALLEMGIRAQCLPLTAAQLQRAAQLIQRSNQFNFRTQRISQECLSARLKDPMRPVFCFQVQDRFGDYGLIAVVCTEIHDKECFISEFVMSCRVLARGVEEFIVNALLAEARIRQLEWLVTEYLPTAKNALVKEVLPRVGFGPDPSAPNRWRINVAQALPLTTCVQTDDNIS